MKQTFTLWTVLMLSLLAAHAQPVFYGAALLGGTEDHGTLFSLNIGTNTYTKLKEFPTGAPSGVVGDIGNPQGKLLLASNGLLYGVAESGGKNNIGGIFSFNPSTNVYTRLLAFENMLNGAQPEGGLIQASNGLLYGMTMLGGLYGKGVIYSFNPENNFLTKVFDFTGVDGTGRIGQLVEASDGLLYGLAGGNETQQHGGIFSFNPASNIYTKVLDFGDYAAGGSSPMGSLFQASDGLLYGTTNEGGIYHGGILFSFNPLTKEYKK